MDELEAMKAELAMMREEKRCMDAGLIVAQSAVEEKKRLVSEYKAMVKLVNDMVDVVIDAEAGGDNFNQNSGQDLDQETMKSLIEEAMRDFTEVLNDAQSRRIRPVNGGNIGGGPDGSSGDHNVDIVNEGIGKDGGDKDGAAGGGHAE
ncbi:hypothetical protein PTKIN_Ptkin06aG0166400 [Pterospermum kingtungense]